MKFKSLVLHVVVIAQLGLAACRGEEASPTTAVIVTSQSTPEAATVVATAPATPTATAVPTESAPTAARFGVEEISFQSGHFAIVGDLQMPAAERRLPAIIMVHGDGSIDRYDSGKYRPIMARFLRAGYAVLSWDKPGTGDSSGEFADGAWIVTDRASILVDGVEFLKGHPAIDPEKIGVWGISQGGYVVPMALTMTDDIAFMIMVSGPGMDGIDQFAYLIGQQVLCAGYSEEEASLAQQSFAGLARAETYQEYQGNWVALSSIEMPEGISFTGKELTAEEDWSPWDRSVDAFFNPMEVVERTTIPVLAFYGEKDRQVDPVQGAQAYEQALQRAGNQDYRVELIPGVAHVLAFAETGCMNEHRPRVYAPEYLDLMEEWLVQLSVSSPRPGGGSDGLIAFYSNRDGNSEIYAVRGNGSSLRKLTSNSTDDMAPAISPDGTRIAFRSASDIYVMNIDGTGRQRLTSNPAYESHPDWSPDGTRIAFVSERDGNREIYVMDADGSGVQRVTDDPADDIRPDWSPDGMQILFNSERDGNFEIYAVNTDGSNLRRLTDDPKWEMFPQWSPDGTQIAYTLHTPGQWNQEICVMDANGANSRQLTDLPAASENPVWSPDGAQIAFQTDRDGNFEIYVMDADGDNQRRLTNDPAGDYWPSWGPSAIEASSQSPTRVPADQPTAPSERDGMPAVTSLHDTWTRPTDEMVMVYVPSGTFQMGSTEAQIEDAIALCKQHYSPCNRWYYMRASPQHSVSLDGFWLDQTEVTNAQFRQCVEEGVCSEPLVCRKGEPTYPDTEMLTHPVVCVDWHAAREYCEWAGARLPTEAEWEYAFRGVQGVIYPWGDFFDGDRLNYCDANCDLAHADDRYDDGYSKSAPAGSYPAGASWCGALGMGGNVSEWVADWLSDYSPELESNPVGPSSGNEKILRGCSWFSHPAYCRAAIRASVSPDTRFDYVGFRCAVP